MAATSKRKLNKPHAIDHQKFLACRRAMVYLPLPVVVKDGVPYWDFGRGIPFDVPSVSASSPQELYLATKRVKFRPKSQQSPTSSAIKSEVLNVGRWGLRKVASRIFRYIVPNGVADVHQRVLQADKPTNGVHTVPVKEKMEHEVTIIADETSQKKEQKLPNHNNNNRRRTSTDKTRNNGGERFAARAHNSLIHLRHRIVSKDNRLRNRSARSLTNNVTCHKCRKGFLHRWLLRRHLKSSKTCAGNRSSSTKAKMVKHL